MISDKCEERTIPVGGSELTFWIYGNIKNPVVFYLHGFVNSFSQNSGDLPVRYLMEKYCVIPFDLPGWGRSKNVSIKTSEAIDQIAKNIGAEKFFIFGTSYGGVIAMLYAIQNSNRLNGIIIAGVPKFGIKSIFSFLTFSKSFSHNKLHVFGDLVRIQKDSSKINIPVLLLYSTNDQIATVSNGNYFAKKIPNSRIVIINGKNHSWLLHRIIDNDFGREVENFLRVSVLKSM